MKPQPSGTGYDILDDLPGDARIPAKSKRAETRRPEPLPTGGPMPWHRRSRSAARLEETGSIAVAARF
jgi:hypothetical protein